MLNATTILSAGRDELLLSTRTAVLQSQGYNVVQAVTFREIVEYLLAESIDLVVLCHSIPLEERGKVVCLVQNQARFTPVLTVSAFEGQSEPPGTVRVRNRPQDILDAVAKMTNRNSQSLGRSQTPPPYK